MPFSATPVKHPRSRSAFKSNNASKGRQQVRRAAVEALEQRTLLSASIWDDSVPPPPAAMSNDTNSTELGVRFRSDSDGYITGVRFYKANLNTGTHVGNLWDTSGQHLASATFTNETEQGWQQVSFASPVHITHDTTYIASYFAPKGHYTVSNGYFSATGADSDTPPPQLHALRDGADGANGLFAYSAASQFPDQTFTSNNYWVDVLFDVTLVPQVTDTTPAYHAVYVDPAASPTVTFNVAMDPNSINSNTVFLNGPGNVQVPATVSYDAAHHAATIDPAGTLAQNATYTIVVRSGATGVKSAAADALTSDFTSTFRVQPFAPNTLWPASATPSDPSFNDSSGADLGVRFRADADGAIAGVRFYKGAGNTGTHTGSLWSSSGALLATATFTNETDTGWQQVTFDSPVVVHAGDSLIASYFAPNGHYALDAGYFAAAGVESGQLYAYKDGEAGGNGVYAQPSTGGVFPQSTTNSNNYWVDVVFFPGALQESNSPPTATPQTVNVDEGGQVAIVLGAQDAETATADLTFRIDTLPGRGTLKYNGVAVTAGQTFTGPPAGLTYEPGGDQGGYSTSFTFSVADPEGLASGPAAVSIAVAAVNDAPVAQATSVTVLEGGSTSVILAGTDEETSDAQLRFRIDSLPTQGLLKFGGAVVTLNQLLVGSPALLTYEPFAATRGGTDGFTYSAVDAQNLSSTSASVSITIQEVNDPPVAQAGSVVVLEGGSAPVTLAGTDEETPAAQLKFRIDSLPTLGTLKFNGTAVQVGQTIDGSAGLTYEPFATTRGSTDGFTFSAIDGDGLDSASAASVSITIQEVNDRPVAKAGSVSLAEDVSTAITLGGSDEETPAGQLRFRIDALPTRGVLKYNGAAVKVGQIFTGSPAGLTYEPGAETEGGTADAITFTVLDADGAVSDPATVAININKAVADGAVVLGSDGILRIGGTAGDDVISVSRTSTGKFRVTLGLKILSDTIPVAGVSEIRIWGRQGCDAIALVDVNTRALISGGDGNDALGGGNGDDLLLGGNGDDALSGFSGNDVLAGGAGRDALYGMDGHDVLIAGSIAADTTAAALRAMGAEWAASKTTTAQKAAAADQVVTDSEFDILNGGSGSDWFIVSKGDSVLDYTAKGSSTDVITYVS